MIFTKYDRKEKCRAANESVLYGVVWAVIGSRGGKGASRNAEAWSFYQHVKEEKTQKQVHERKQSKKIRKRVRVHELRTQQ